MRRLPKTQARAADLPPTTQLSRAASSPRQCSRRAQPSRPPPVSPRPLPVSDGGCSSHRLRAPPKPAALRYTALRRTAYTPRTPEQPWLGPEEAPPHRRPPRGARPSSPHKKKDGRRPPPLPPARLTILSKRTRPASTTTKATASSSSPSPPREKEGARPQTRCPRRRGRRRRAKHTTGTASSTPGTSSTWTSSSTSVRRWTSWTLTRPPCVANLGSARRTCCLLMKGRSPSARRPSTSRLYIASPIRLGETLKRWYRTVSNRISRARRRRRDVAVAG